MGRHKRKSRAGGPADQDAAVEDAELATVGQVDQPAASTTSQTPRRRWRKRLVVVVAGMLLVALTLPILFAKTGLAHWVLHRAIADLPIDIQFDSIRLSWWSGPKLGNVVVTDPDQQPLARLDDLSVERSLWRLLLAPSELGTIRVHAPQVWVRVRADGSNLEDLLAAIPPAEESTTQPVPSLQLQIEQGRINLSSNRADHARWELGKIDGTISVGNENLVAAQLTAQVFRANAAASEDASPEISTSTGKLRLSVGPQADSTSPNGADVEPTDHRPAAATRTISVTADVEDCALGPLQLAAYRAGHHVQIDGHGSGHTNVRVARLTEDSTAAVWCLDQLATEIELTAIRIRDENWQRDELQLDKAHVQLGARTEQNRLVLELCELNSPLGGARLSGSFSAAELASSAFSMQSLSQYPLDCSGSVRLAELARQLPHVLSLHDDLTLTAGEVRWHVANEIDVDGAGRRLSGQFETANIAGSRAGRPIVLRDPMKIDFEVTQDEAGQPLTAEKVSATSSFLTAVGRGDLQQGGMRWRADGQRLVAELEQFFDLSGIQIGGTLDGQLEWSTAADQWRINGRATGKQLAVSLPGRSTLDEPNVVITLDATGRVKDRQLEQLESAIVGLSCGDDRVSARLTTAVTKPSLASQWPLLADIQGDLSRWSNRLEWASSVALPRVAGDITGRGTLAVSSRSITATPLEINARNVRVAAGTHIFAEPALKLSANGSFDLTTQRLECAIVTLASTSVSIKADQFVWPFDPTSATASRVFVRGDLAKISQRLMPAGSAHPEGQILSQLQLLPQGREIAFQSATTIEQFQWVDARAAGQRGGQPSIVWQEPKVKLDVAGSWALTTSDLTVNHSQCETDGVTVSLAGTIRDLARSMRVDLTGQTRIDHDRLAARLRPQLGADVRLTGINQKPLAIQGPLRASPANSVATSSARHETHPISQRPLRPATRLPTESTAWLPAELQAQFGFGWQSAEAYGLSVGPTAVDARVENRTLSARPIEMEVAGGKLRLTPKLPLSAPWVLSLEPGVVVDRVAVTPQMCAQWLKYIAPLVADATSAEGQFSVRVASAEIPVLATYRAAVGGSLAIHTARVGPGPAARELLTLAQQIRSLLDPERGQSQWLETDRNWITFPEQVVSFRVENGRVAHRDLKMVVGDVEISTRGAIGFDQRMDLVAEIPIQAAWVERNRWLANLKGQAIEVPVRGTVDRPQVDRSVLQRLAERAAQSAAKSAAQNLLQNEVQKQLKGLFK